MPVWKGRWKGRVIASRDPALLSSWNLDSLGEHGIQSRGRWVLILPVLLSMKGWTGT